MVNGMAFLSPLFSKHGKSPWLQRAVLWFFGDSVKNSPYSTPRLFDFLETDGLLVAAFFTAIRAGKAKKRVALERFSPFFTFRNP